MDKVSCREDVNKPLTFRKKFTRLSYNLANNHHIFPKSGLILKNYDRNYTYFCICCNDFVVLRA